LIIATSILSVAVHCLANQSWHKTKNFEIDLLATPLDILSVSSDGPVFVQYYPVETTDAILTIQVRVYSLETEAAEDYLEDFDLVYTGNSAKLETKYRNKNMGCLQTETNIFIPSNAAVENLYLDIQTEFADTIVDSLSSEQVMNIGSLFINSKGKTVRINNVHAKDQFYITNDISTVRTNNTQARYTRIRNSNAKINVSFHEILNEVDSVNVSPAFLDVKTSNANVNIWTSLRDQTEPGSIIVESSNAKVVTEVVGVTGQFDIKTSNGDAKVIGGDSDNLVDYTMQKKDHKVGTIGQDGAVGQHTVKIRSSNSDSSFK